MTSRAIIRRRAYHAGSSGEYRSRGSATAASEAPHIRSRTPPLLHEEIDPIMARWWRATRIVRRLSAVAKS